MAKKQGFTAADALKLLGREDIKELAKLAGDRHKAIEEVVRLELALQKATGLDTTRNLIVGSIVNSLGSIVDEVLEKDGK